MLIKGFVLAGRNLAQAGQAQDGALCTRRAHFRAALLKFMAIQKLGLQVFVAICRKSPLFFRTAGAILTEIGERS